MVNAPTVFQAENMLLRSFAVLVLSTLITTETQARSAEENRLLNAAFDAQADTQKLFTLELGALQASHHRVERNGERLILHLNDGGSKIFENSPSCKIDNSFSDCARYSLIADVKSAGIIILVHAFYEGGAFDLTDDRTGRSIEVDDMPLLSPSSQRILVLHNSVWGSLSGIEIWRHAHGNFVKEWAGDPREDKTGVDAFGLDNWASEQRVILRYSSPLGQDPSRNAVHHFTMTLTADKWAVSNTAN